MDNYKPRTDVGAKLGGGSKCERCGLTVGIAEKVQFAGGKVYHKTCFACSACSKSLAKGSESEHAGKPYCQMCHAKMTSTVGKAPASAAAPSIGSISSSSSSSSSSIAAAAGDNACARCGKTVGMAERVRAANRVYHKGCFSCKVCNTHLDGNYSEDKNKDVYCDRCYGKTHQMKMGDAAASSLATKQSAEDPHARLEASASALKEVQDALSRVQVSTDEDFIKANEQGAADILKSLSSFSAADASGETSETVATEDATVGKGAE